MHCHSPSFGASQVTAFARPFRPLMRRAECTEPSAAKNRTRKFDLRVGTANLDLGFPPTNQLDRCLSRARSCDCKCGSGRPGRRP